MFPITSKLIKWTYSWIITNPLIIHINPYPHAHCRFMTITYTHTYIKAFYLTTANYSYKPCSFKNVDSSNTSLEAFSWQIYNPKGFALTFFVFISSSPLDEVATVCPFLMRESKEKGGKSMLARQVRVAPLSLLVACLSASKYKSTPIIIKLNY